MSPLKNGTRVVRPAWGMLLGLVCAMGICALLPSKASGQGEALTAPRPMRRLDTEIPLQLVNASADVDPVVTEKTPIRRLDTETSLQGAGGRSPSMMWLIVGGIVAAAVGVSWWTRRGVSGGHWKLPSTVFQVLGRAPVNGTQSVTLLRLGERIVLVSSSGTGLQTLAVVTDPSEVAAMTAECLSQRTVQVTEISAARPRGEGRTRSAARSRFGTEGTGSSAVLSAVDRTEREPGHV